MTLPHLPRIHMHDDPHGFVSIGFTDTQDTILKVGGHDGPGGHGDVATAREWVAAVASRLDVEPLLELWEVSQANRMVIDHAGVIQRAVKQLLGLGENESVAAAIEEIWRYREEYGDGAS